MVRPQTTTRGNTHLRIEDSGYHFGAHRLGLNPCFRTHGWIVGRKLVREDTQVKDKVVRVNALIKM